MVGKGAITKHIGWSSGGIGLWGKPVARLVFQGQQDCP